MCEAFNGNDNNLSFIFLRDSACALDSAILLRHFLNCSHPYLSKLTVPHINPKPEHIVNVILSLSIDNILTANEGSNIDIKTNPDTITTIVAFAGGNFSTKSESSNNIFKNDL